VSTRVTVERESLTSVPCLNIDPVFRTTTRVSITLVS
jgi:hypothetical protein